MTASNHVPTPSVFVELERYLAELVDPNECEYYDATSHFYSEFGCDFEARLVSNTYNVPDEELVEGSLRYHGHPFEFVTFGWQGTDAIQYGHVVHTLELDQGDYPAGCYAPGDIVTWLADSTKQALEVLLAAGTSQSTQETCDALCRRLSLTPDFAHVVPPGSEARPLPPPEAPPGWRFERSDDGIGILAEEKHWCAPLALPKRKTDLSANIQAAKQHCARGKYATALCVLKHAYHHHVYQTREVAAWMADCYHSLGRDFLVRRVESYLKLHLRVKKTGRGFDILRDDMCVGKWIDGALADVVADHIDPNEVAELVKRA